MEVHTDIDNEHTYKFCTKYCLNINDHKHGVGENHRDDI